MNKLVRNIIIVVVGSLAIFSLGLYVAFRNELSPTQQPTANEQVQQKILVDFLLDDGDKLTGYRDIEVPSGATVLDALQAVTGQNNLALDVDRSSSMGAFIKQIGAKKNGQSAKYWQYWVNGAQPLVAADKLQLRGGEVILWTFRKSVF